MCTLARKYSAESMRRVIARDNDEVKIEKREREGGREREDISEKGHQSDLMIMSLCLSMSVALLVQHQRRDREFHLLTTASSSKFNDP